MKRFNINLLLSILFLFISIICYSQTQNNGLIPDIIKYYKVSSKDNLLEDGHLFNKSMTTSVQLNLKNLGLGSIIAPPYFCYPFTVTLKIFDSKVLVKNYDWYPSETNLIGENIKGIESRLKIFPISSGQGVVAELELTNTNKSEQTVPIDWIMEGQLGTSNNWEWYPPAALYSKKENTLIRNDSVTYIFKNDSAIALIKGFGINTFLKNKGLSSITNLKPLETRVFGITIILNSDETKQGKVNSLDINPADLLLDTRKHWEKLLRETESKAPKIEGGSNELTSFYKKGLFTFLTCRWEIPEFVMNPWYAESGIDGGALNNYYWGLAYISRLMSVMEPVSVRKLLLSYVYADLANSYALNPSNGKGMGVLYSYNYYSIARATYDYIVITGDTTILSEKINNETYQEYIYRFCLMMENLKKDPELIDYGGNHNLLELKLTNDYTNFTPSPNAERLLIYRYLADFFRWVNKPIPHNLENRSEKLRKVFQEKLWDSPNNWLYSLDKNNQKLTAYSIQIFDVFRTGILTKAQESVIVKHLNQQEFLSPYGVYSLAKTDEGYDTNDADWGGPGVYAGDAPELVEDLIHSGFENEGVDILKRILWWGRLPYYPQAIRADKMGYRENGRPNVIAGLATTQSIIFGLFGIVLDRNNIFIKPVKDPILFGVSLTDLKIRGENISIHIDQDGVGYQIKWRDKTIFKKIGNSTIIKINNFLN